MYFSPTTLISGYYYSVNQLIQLYSKMGIKSVASKILHSYIKNKIYEVPCYGIFRNFRLLTVFWVKKFLLSILSDTLTLCFSLTENI